MPHVQLKGISPGGNYEEHKAGQAAWNAVEGIREQDCTGLQRTGKPDARSEGLLLSPNFSKADKGVMESEETNNHGVDDAELDNRDGIQMFYWKVTKHGLDISDVLSGDG